MDCHMLAVVMASLLILMGESAQACSDNCTCRSLGEEYEMICHKQNRWNGQETKMKVLKDKLLLHCSDDAEAGDIYSWTVQSKTEWSKTLEKVKFVIITDCPLPTNSTSLKEAIGFGNITVLNINNYKGQDLQRNHFSGLGASLKNLLLSQNSITSLPEDVFQELGSALKEVDLRQNLLTHVPYNSLASLKGLKYLELGNNYLKVLEEGEFSNFSSLTFLNLWGNKNLQLHSKSFFGLRNLTSLDLSVCNLSSLPSGVFSELPRLQNLSLVGNNFTTLPEKLFSSLTNLTELKFFNNRKALKHVPSGLLANLKNLKKIYFHSNNITEIPENFIFGSENVTVLQLQKNCLQKLPQLLLKNAYKLEDLDVSHNELQSLPDSLFESTNKLQTINLSYNKISYLQKGVLHGLNSAITLLLSHNQISSIEYHSFPVASSIEILDLSYNRLGNLAASEVNMDFGISSVFEGLFKLKVLNLSHNYISSIYSDWLLLKSFLNKLDLSFNNISSVNADDLQFLQGNITVDLRNSNLSEINLLGLEALATVNLRSSPIKILIGGNAINCGCNGYYFLRYVDGSVPEAVRKLIQIDFNGVTCLGTQRPVKEVSSHDVLCDDKCCPPPWKCKIRPWDRAWLLKCDGCWVGGTVPPKPKSCMKVDHTEVDLHHNEFHTIPTEVLNLKPKITALRLSHNSLQEIDVPALSSSLKELHLDNNNLRSLSDEVVELMSNGTHLKNISLYANPWECNCKTKNLLQFLQDNYEKVYERSNIKCGNGYQLVEMTNDELCPLHKMTIIIISVSLAIIGISLGLTAFLYYRYQQDVKIWLYARSLCLWFVTEEELDKDKLYDAFVSYSHKDEDFVVGKLVAGLETGPIPFKLCLHYRDWIAGDWIAEQIARSVERSRRTLVVLSPNFLESVWGKMEFRAAHRKALSDGLSRVIVVIYGDLGDVEKLDPELKAYLSTNTYVKWGDPWFWDKLRYALPHIPKARAANNNNTSDKLELIVSGNLGPLSTPTNEINNPMEKQTNGHIKCYDNSVFVSQ